MTKFTEVQARERVSGNALTKFASKQGKSRIQFQGFEEITWTHKTDKVAKSDYTYTDKETGEKVEVKKGDITHRAGEEGSTKKYKGTFRVKAYRRSGGTYYKKFKIEFFGQKLTDEAYKPNLLAALLAVAGIIKLEDMFDPSQLSLDEVDSSIDDDFDDDDGGYENTGVECDDLDDDFDDEDEDEAEEINYIDELNGSDLLGNTFMAKLSSGLNDQGYETFYIDPLTVEEYVKPADR